jgi:hypothetical protein
MSPSTIVGLCAGTALFGHGLLIVTDARYRQKFSHHPSWLERRVLDFWGLPPTAEGYLRMVVGTSWLLLIVGGLQLCLAVVLFLGRH